VALIFENVELQIALLIGLTLLVATVVVRVSGFGSSVVAMPILVPLITLAGASPLVNLFGVTNHGLLIARRWRNLKIDDMWRNIVAAVITTPFGIWLTFVVAESTMRLILGTICILYALYNFSTLPQPKLVSPYWGWGFGLIAGVFSGAFNVGGVPTVIFADTQNWEPERFRLNMFTYFLITGALALVSRYIAGQITLRIIGYWLLAIPFLFLGLLLGRILANLVNRQRFRQLVLLLLIILGGRLIWGVFF